MKKILVVDDDPDIIKLVKMLLSYLGYDVKVITDSRLVENEVTRYSPDLVLLDIQMPFFNGFEICEKIRAKNLSKDLKIVLFTAIADEDVLIKGNKVGANDVLIKPFSIQQLRLSIEKNLIENPKK